MTLRLTEAERAEICAAVPDDAPVGPWVIERALEAARASDAIRNLIIVSDVIADLCGGVIGADNDDLVGSIKAHFSDLPSMWLRDAMIDAVDAYRVTRAAVMRARKELT